MVVGVVADGFVDISERLTPERGTLHSFPPSRLSGVLYHFSALIDKHDVIFMFVFAFFAGNYVAAPPSIVVFGVREGFGVGFESAQLSTGEVWWQRDKVPEERLGFGDFAGPK